jgi:hypothetical protein
MDYWKELIEEAFEDAGIVATPEQVSIVANWAESGHENYRQAMGHDVASRNWHAQNETEKEQLRKAIIREKNKVTCLTCAGTGETKSYFGTFVATSQCSKCHGDGRHD